MDGTQMIQHRPCQAVKTAVASGLASMTGAIWITRLVPVVYTEVKQLGYEFDQCLVVNGIVVVLFWINDGEHKFKKAARIPVPPGYLNHDW